MKISEALDIVLNLAIENVIDDPDMEEVAERQNEAIELIQNNRRRIINAYAARR